MDDVLSFVLDGLEDYLELERELGVRSVEVDRSLLATPPSSVVAVAPRVAPVVPTAKRDVSPPQPLTPSTPQPITPVAFIHDRPLSPKAVAMMAKTIVALGYADDATPVVVTRPIPKARRYVFLGHRALQTYLPGLRVEENARFRTPKGVEALLVKSPEEIVRFATETPAVHQAKTAMWRALKAFAKRQAQ